jgi:hypothetical protein
MAIRQNVEQAIELSMLDPYEQALRVPNHSAWQRRLTLGMLMFSLAFCAVVFYAGWKEIAALPCHRIAPKQRTVRLALLRELRARVDQAPRRLRPVKIRQVRLAKRQSICCSFTTCY